MDYEAYATDTESEVGDSYESAVIDDMLDALMESVDGGEFAERRKRRRAQRKGVPAAKGANAYRAPVPSTYVTQKQLADALSRVGEDVRRNAMGIKTLNEQVSTLTGQVKDVVSVNRVQSERIARLDKLMRIDGALDIAKGFVIATDTAGAATGITVDPAHLLTGALKSGALGDMKGALGNPALLAGLGFVLNNRAPFFNMLKG